MESNPVENNESTDLLVHAPLSRERKRNMEENYENQMNQEIEESVSKIQDNREEEHGKEEETKIEDERTGGNGDGSVEMEIEANEKEQSEPSRYHEDEDDDDNDNYNDNDNESCSQDAVDPLPQVRTIGDQEQITQSSVLPTKSVIAILSDFADQSSRLLKEKSRYLTNLHYDPVYDLYQDPSKAMIPTTLVRTRTVAVVLSCEKTQHHKPYDPSANSNNNNNGSNEVPEWKKDLQFQNNLSSYAYEEDEMCPVVANDTMEIESKVTEQSLPISHYFPAKVTSDSSEKGVYLIRLVDFGELRPNQQFPIHGSNALVLEVYADSNHMDERSLSVVSKLNRTDVVNMQLALRVRKGEECLMVESASRIMMHHDTTSLFELYWFLLQDEARAASLRDPRDGRDHFMREFLFPPGEHDKEKEKGREKEKEKEKEKESRVLKGAYCTGDPVDVYMNNQKKKERVRESYAMKSGGAGTRTEGSRVAEVRQKLDPLVTKAMCVRKKKVSTAMNKVIALKQSERIPLESLIGNLDEMAITDLMSQVKKMHDERKIQIQRNGMPVRILGVWDSDMSILKL